MTDKERGAVILGMFGAVCVATSVGMFFGAGFGFLGFGTFCLIVGVWAA